MAGLERVAVRQDGNCSGTQRKVMAEVKLTTCFTISQKLAAEPRTVDANSARWTHEGFRLGSNQ